MKKVKQIDTVPASLQPFLKAYPPETRDKRDWNTFKNEEYEAYSELIQALTDIQHGLCAYCEINIIENDYKIEHFHPKSDISSETDWMFEITNLFAACKGGTQTNGAKTRHPDQSRCLPPIKKNRSCGEAKDDNVMDEDILKPSDLPISPALFSITQKPQGGIVNKVKEGALKVNENACLQAGIDPKKVEATIDTFNLNCDRLCLARKTVLEKLEEDFELELADLGENPSDNQIKSVLEKMAKYNLAVNQDGTLPAFFSTIRIYFLPYAESVLAQSPQNGI
ncbi:MAG TPA: TIGR02646 family protein [Beggiatoa sp.]|nr:MAG: TIGR02646 family protein [Gammaproteobacteria bacterium]HEW99022.1 TIGR02646 family protein [Beggiatoa sp.]